MSEFSKIDPQLLPSTSHATPAGKAPVGVAGSSAAFEVLLERLTSRAAELEQRSRSVETPEQVGDAVDAARASLEDALTLGERLLEAYRHARQVDPSSTSSSIHSGPNAKGTR